MKVRVQVAQSLRQQIPAALVRRVAARVSAAARRVGQGGPRLGTLTVRLTDLAEISDLHLRFMNLAGPTDVLSFPPEPCAVDDGLEAGAEGADPSADPLGDVVIAWPVACAQSQRWGLGVQAHESEVVDLALHGLAHLLGHDHGTRSEARAMYRLERRLSRAVGLGTPARPYAPGSGRRALSS